MKVRDRYNALIHKYCLFGIWLFALLISINLFIAIVLQGRALPHGTIRMTILEGFLIGALLANRKSSNLSAQLYLIGIYWAFLLYPFTPLFISKPAEDLFLYIFITLILNSLVIVLIKSNLKILTGFWLLTINITFIYGLRITIQRLNPDVYLPIKDIFVEVPILVYSFTIIFIFISLVTRKFKTEQEKASDLLDRATKELSKERSILEYQHTQLTETINQLKKSEIEIKETNSSLEDRINQRLNDLKLMNERILNHGFLNSVTIRESFDKILLNYDDSSKLDEESEFKFYSKVTDELDQIITSIGQNLQLTDTELNE